MKPLFLTISMVFGFAAMASAASAEEVCMSADEMGAALIDWYGERPISEPSEANEQIWVSQQTGTWTLVKTFSDGNACVIAQGEDWNGGLASEEMIAGLAD